jgi:hypothetical protein
MVKFQQSLTGRGDAAGRPEETGSVYSKVVALEEAEVPLVHGCP